MADANWAPMGTDYSHPEHGSMHTQTYYTGNPMPFYESNSLFGDGHVETSTTLERLVIRWGTATIAF